MIYDIPIISLTVLGLRFLYPLVNSFAVGEKCVATRECELIVWHTKTTILYFMILYKCYVHILYVNKQTNTDDNIAIYDIVTYLLRVYPLFRITPILYYFLQTKYKQYKWLDKVGRYNYYYTIRSVEDNY